MNEGWKCPVCGRGVAPSEKHCEHGSPLPGFGPVYIPTHWPATPGPDEWRPPPPVTCGASVTAADIVAQWWPR